jgi:hypothetical protein
MIHTDDNDAGWTMVHIMDTAPDMEGGEFLYPTMGVAFRLRHGDVFTFNPRYPHGTAAFKNQPTTPKGQADRIKGEPNVVCTAWFLSKKIILALGGSIKKPLVAP